MHSGLRTRAVLAATLAAVVASRAEAQAFASPAADAPSQVFQEDITILKTTPRLTFADGVTADFALRKSSQGTAFALLDFAVGSKTPLGLWASSVSTGVTITTDSFSSSARYNYFSSPTGTYPVSVGIGGGAGGGFPAAPLHVQSAKAYAETRPLLLLENYNEQVLGRNLLRLSNNGPATFRFENQAALAARQAGAVWSFGQRALGNEFFIATAGAPSLNMTMDPNGNMTIAGSLAQMSDRNSKHEIEAVDSAELLERVAALPVSTWSYKGDQARHIGPMAQDFAAAFGLGSDDKHVAPSDVAGVGLAAVQALMRQLEQTNARLARLEGELAQREGEAAERP
jgi:hypothetical protein